MKTLILFIVTLCYLYAQYVIHFKNKENEIL